jgi:hypothetical protein
LEPEALGGAAFDEGVHGVVAHTSDDRVGYLAPAGKACEALKRGWRLFDAWRGCERFWGGTEGKV